MPTPADVDRLRAEGNDAFADLLKKVRELPANLPATCKLVGAWSVGSQDIISFIVVEAGSFADFQTINAYYIGWFQIKWHPTAVIERD